MRRIVPLTVLLALSAHAAPAAAGVRVLKQSPMALEIREARARLGARLAELEAGLARAADQASQASLAAEIESAKTQAEAEMLGIQARHARAAGSLRAAEKLEAAAARLRAAPLAPAPTAPVSRAALRGAASGR